MICIAGKNRIAVDAVKYLIKEIGKDNICILANVTDDGVDSWQPSLAFFAEKQNLKKVTLKETYNIENLIFISLEFDKIIKPHLFKSQNLYNIHFSLLPKYKGMFTSIMPLLSGEIDSGVTLHRIDTGIDTGEVIDQLKFPIELEENSRDLYEKYLKYGFLLFKKNIGSILKQEVSSQAQSVVGASYYSRKQIDFKNIIIDYNKTAFEIHNQFRAFCFRDYQLPQYQEFLIYKTELTQTSSSIKSGSIIKETDEYFELSTIDYNIKLFKDYYTLLWEACVNGSIDKVQKIIHLIPDVNLRNKNGWNAIILATYNYHDKLIEYLLRIGANINSTNYKGTSVLMYAKNAALIHNDFTIISDLLNEGANINHQDNKGKTVLDYAKLDGNNLLIDYLMNKGAE